MNKNYTDFTLCVICERGHLSVMRGNAAKTETILIPIYTCSVYQYLFFLIF